MPDAPPSSYLTDESIRYCERLIPLSLSLLNWWFHSPLQPWRYRAHPTCDSQPTVEERSCLHCIRRFAERESNIMGAFLMVMVFLLLAIAPPCIMLAPSRSKLRRK